MTRRWSYPRNRGWRSWRQPTWRRLLRRRWIRDLAIGLIVIAVIGIAQLVGSPPSFELAAQEPVAAGIDLRVIDGDTVEVRGGGERIRLENIDTPETGDRARCAAEREAGVRATAEARRLVNGAGNIDIRRTGRTDQYGRTIGWVSVDGRDLGRLLIEAGLARPWRGRREPWCGPSGELLR
ncbi:MAG: thermonuclease family protein [Hyphomonadaceae bacterium]|nr:thermonuclease family protein [Hyphomonadaceae bacterium]